MRDGPEGPTEPGLAARSGGSVRKKGPPGLMAWQTGFLAYVLGILALARPLEASLCLLLVLVAAVVLRARIPALWAVAAFFLLGAGHAWLRLPDPPAHEPAFIAARTKVRLTGRVADVTLRPEQRARVILSQVRCETPDGEAVSLVGRVVLNWDYPPRIPLRGDRITAVVRIKPTDNFLNPGAWDFAWYWRCRGVFYRTYLRGGAGDETLEPGTHDLFTALRERVAGSVLERLPRTPGGDIMAALVLGDRFRMSLDTEEMVRSAGLAHTLALSGLHVGFVAGLGALLAWLAGWCCPGLLLRVPRPKLTVLVAAPLVLGYAWLGGFTPSLVRASLMFGAWGGLLLLDRENVLVDGLFLALAAILLSSPLSAYDLSLQLSALAVAGIAFLLPLFRRFRLSGTGWWRRAANGVAMVFFVSLGATLGIFPLVASTFGEVSPNLFMNLFWLPLLGIPVMPLGLAGFLLCQCPWTAGAGGWLLLAGSRVLDAMLWCLSWLSGAGLTPRVAVMRPDWVQMAGWGLAAAGIVALCSGVPRRRALGLAGLGALCMVGPLVVPAAFQEAGRVEVAVLDVGQGQAVLVASPSGERWLVDGGGPGSRRFDIGRAVVAPVLARKRLPRLDGVVLTHPDADHYKGLLYFLESFHVGRFYHNGRETDGSAWRELRQSLERGGVPDRAVAAGDVLDMGGGLTARVLHPAASYRPGRSNDASLVLLLEWRGRGLALIAGDVEREGIDVLSASGRPLDCELLVVPHHGSDSSLSPGLYASLGGRAAFISAGRLNQFHFPHAAVVEGLQDAGYAVYVTARDGMLRAVWDNPDAPVTFESHCGGRLPNGP